MNLLSAQSGIPFVMNVDTAYGRQTGLGAFGGTGWPFGLRGGGSVPEYNGGSTTFPVSSRT